MIITSIEVENRVRQVRGLTCKELCQRSSTCSPEGVMPEGSKQKKKPYVSRRFFCFFCLRISTRTHLVFRLEVKECL
ncbi:hypothetical protein T492DRAFT_1090808 [Pavlovales sp. CCMP2436]|nr:hypothetical protein T492DRAFT_1090808 [Pavlovales sp. CCMP2436]